MDTGGVYRRAALAAAAVADLAQEGRVQYSEHRNPRVAVVNPEPTDRPALDAVLDSLAKRPRRLSMILGMPGGNLTTAAGRALAEEGVLREKGRLLIGPAFPTVDGEPEARLRSRLRGVLDGAIHPEFEDAAVLAILQGAGVAFSVLKAERGDRTRPELRRLIASIVEDFPLAVSLRTAMKNHIATAASAGASA